MNIIKKSNELDSRIIEYASVLIKLIDYFSHIRIKENIQLIKSVLNDTKKNDLKEFLHLVKLISKS